MNRPNYDPRLYPWYSPKRVIKGFIWFGQNYGENINHHQFKKAREMYLGAVTLLGAYKLGKENKYFLQLNLQSETPDIMAAIQIEKPGQLITLAHTQMELVEMEDHYEGDNVFEFLKSKKLFPVKDYDEHTMIVCIVNKTIQVNIDNLVERLKAEKPKSTIYIVGRISGTDVEKFVIFSPYPQLTKSVIFDVSETALSYELPEAVTMVKGGAQKISYSEMRTVPFNIYEAFGVNEEKVITLRKK
jgi:hypothetical protein